MIRSRFNRRASRQLLCVFSSLFFVLVSGPSQAEWTGGVEGGTEVSDAGSTTRLRFRAINDIRPLSHSVYAEWLRDNDGNNSYEIGYVPRYWFTEVVYAFGDARLGVNKALQIDASRYLVAGVGAEPVRSENTSVYAEIGVGTQEFEFASGTETSESIAVARAAAIHSPVENVQLSAEFDASKGEDVDQAEFETGISLAVPTGSIRYSYRKQWLRIGDGDTIEEGKSFFSYSFGF